MNLGYFYAVYKSVSRFDHTHIASDLLEVARRSRDGGVKIHQMQKFTAIGGVPSHRREKRADAVASAQVVI